VMRTRGRALTPSDLVERNLPRALPAVGGVAASVALFVELRHGIADLQSGV
jgi:hypothetical protein